MESFYYGKLLWWQLLILVSVSCPLFQFFFLSLPHNAFSKRSALKLPNSLTKTRSLTKLYHFQDFFLKSIDASIKIYQTFAFPLDSASLPDKLSGNFYKQKWILSHLDIRMPSIEHKGKKCDETSQGLARIKNWKAIDFSLTLFSLENMV